MVALNNPDWPTIRPRFRRIREQRGLDSIAYELGCSRASVHRWALDDGPTPIPLYARAIRQLVVRHEGGSQVTRPAE